MDKNTREMLHHWRELEPGDRLAHLVRDASRAFARALQIALAERSVPLGHWTFLRILWRQDGLTQKQLSDRAGVMEPSTFQALKVMESLGYIERRHRPDNQKNVHVYLTAKGRALEKRLVPLAERVNELAVRGVSEESLMVTRRTLLRIIENLAEQPPKLKVRSQPSAGVKRKGATEGTRRRRTNFGAER